MDDDNVSFLINDVTDNYDVLILINDFIDDDDILILVENVDYVSILINDVIMMIFRS